MKPVVLDCFAEQLALCIFKYVLMNKVENFLTLFLIGKCGLELNKFFAKSRVFMCSINYLI